MMFSLRLVSPTMYSRSEPSRIPSYTREEVRCCGIIFSSKLPFSATLSIAFTRPAMLAVRLAASLALSSALALAAVICGVRETV